MQIQCFAAVLLLSYMGAALNIVENYPQTAAGQLSDVA
jgi:hypothetical protein